MNMIEDIEENKVYGFIHILEYIKQLYLDWIFIGHETTHCQVIMLCNPIINCCHGQIYIYMFTLIIT